MRIGPALRHYAAALLAGFIGGAAGWFLLDSTVSAQSDVVEASKIVVGENVVIENGQIVFTARRRNDSFAALNINGLTVRNGRGEEAQTSTIRPGSMSIVTRYDESPDIWKRIDLESGLIRYFPDWDEKSTSQDVEVLDMDVLFKRQREELNALRNRRHRI